MISRAAPEAVERHEDSADRERPAIARASGAQPGLGLGAKVALVAYLDDLTILIKGGARANTVAESTIAGLEQ
eukprot:13500465-Alexandrium_andersonii.AAC.1